MLVMRQFKINTIAAVGLLLVVHLAAFVTMVVLLLGVQASITDLESSGVCVGGRGRGSL